ncbi:MAG: glyceraldehyde 3-phosphate dehydrogenase [Parcubacteria group bacterium Gr01-1014_2]|nr:MAG: glyceraldehyde 3-phosphate dehydrogenase [Parcubacteria group bacterium Gr01-1014_2]
MKVRIAINGFGRIGRAFFKAAFDRKTKPEFEFAAINDLGDLEQLAYLLKYDSVYGRWGKKVNSKFKIQNSKILEVEDKEILFLQEKEPANLPWRDLNIDIVLESTGVFESFEKAKIHLDAGAKRVVISAPAKDEESDWGKTVLPGVNNEDFAKCKVSSNGSCTTQSASAVMQILKETVGVKKAYLVSAHGYTATQNLIDGPPHSYMSGGGGPTSSRDFRRARAAAINIVPTFTGATLAVARAVKDLNFDGAAFRVPVISGSISAITFLAERPTTVQEINEIFKKAAQDSRWEGILKVTEEPIVSTDIINEPYGAIIDLSMTSVVDNDLVTVFSWYDNEAGYTETLVRHVLEVAKTI